MIVLLCVIPLVMLVILVRDAKDVIAVIQNVMDNASHVKVAILVEDVCLVRAAIVVEGVTHAGDVILVKDVMAAMAAMVVRVVCLVMVVVMVVMHAMVAVEDVLDVMEDITATVIIVAIVIHARQMIARAAEEIIAHVVMRLYIVVYIDKKEIFYGMV